MKNHHETYPSIQICSLQTARETDYSIYDGLITIEDSLEDNPLRINNDLCPQLVLCFDDISLPVDDYILPQKKQFLAFPTILSNRISILLI